MDVRCEKCQTEYELDEARLKPGGVTVKCTNCGHMFKIRKRSSTNVGAPALPKELEPPRSRPVSSKPQPQPAQAEPPRKRPDSMLDGDDPTAVTTRAAPPGPNDSNDGDGPTVPDRQWLIRLENGEQKSCRELASLQQWIVAGVVTRESLISRTGKTWKRLGDVAELAQYFVIADEARATREATREAKPTNRPPAKPPQPTMLGVGKLQSQAAGGTILPDDDDERRSTGNFKARPSTPPPPPPTRTPVAGAATVKPAASTPPPQTARPPTPAPPVTPTPPPSAKPAAEKSWAAMPQEAAGRPTGAWASESLPAAANAPAGPQGPFGGKVSAITDEPAFASKSFAGKVRAEPGDERVFSSGPMKRVDEEEDEMFASRRGSRGGMLLVIVALLVIGAAATVVYIFAFRKKEPVAATKPPVDAAAVAVVPPPDAPSITPVIDAPAAPVSSIATAQAELGADVESRLRAAVMSTEDQAAKAHVMLRLAQDLEDVAGLVTDKSQSDKARKEAKQLVLDAATLAQKALKAQPDDPTASLAMAEVLRLQNKPAKDIKRYLDAASGSKDWTRDVSLATALVLARDGKLDDARAALTGIDTDASDVRPKLHLALIAFTQSKPAEAKPFVDQILATQPEHVTAKALGARLATMVASSDPLPPEEHKDAGVVVNANPPNPNGSGTAPPNPNTGGGGDGYDALIKKANQLAEQANCTKAIELYQKAVEQKPSSVEALTGQGYCHIEAKAFSSAFSKFRAALTISPRYEPALWGIAQAYQQQGRKQDAIDSYKAYLEVYPGSAKAQKQLDRLGAGAGGGTPPDTGSGAGSAVPTPTPTPVPPTPQTPPPTTPDPGTGSGSN